MLSVSNAVCIRGLRIANIRECVKFRQLGYDIIIKENVLLYSKELDVDNHSYFHLAFI